MANFLPEVMLLNWPKTGNKGGGGGGGGVLIGIICRIVLLRLKMRK